jgi:ligand-binding SRPBCC domain-containing protein
MYRLKESIHINAPIDRCFLLSTSIEIVEQTLNLTPVAGQTSGLVVDGSRLTWRGWKFGLPAWHETLITAYDRPHFFQDTMARGMFRKFSHDHRFQDIDGQTLLIDIVHFSMPLGPIGKLMAKQVVIPHVLATMQRRFQLLKRLAEGHGWEQYLVNPAETARNSRLSDQVAGIQSH